ncbi:MAG: hypothetical protein EG825_05840 [Rhodocyclaceae bacterium]|nr:hypothetical protein [Rhodocyclaceae bacterium]
MKLALYSDLHLELMRSGLWQPPPLDVDVVVLAGDIGKHTHGIEWAMEAFRQVPVSPEILYIAGNHEYYDAHLGLLGELQKPRWGQLGVQFLERRVFEWPGVRILGCTLWSGFSLHGADKIDAYMSVARRSINDYWLIHAHNGKRLEPRDTLKLHRKAVRWLDTELAKPFDGRTVVVTHFAPHRGCVPAKFEGSELSPYFVTDLAWLMEKHRIAVWCFGHTHTNCDFVAENGCRVVSNQRGYTSEYAAGDMGFRPDLVIEV